MAAVSGRLLGMVVTWGGGGGGDRCCGWWLKARGCC